MDVPRVERLELAAVAAGGALGALARVSLSSAFPTTAGHWPWVTFAVNILGAFLLGYLITGPQLRPALSRLYRPLLGSGFCGALTTFSTIQIELLGMLDRGHDALAGAYVLASVSCGYVAIHLASTRIRRAAEIA